MIPKEVLLQPIKRNSKEFKKEIAGARLDGKSKILEDKLPKIYHEYILKGDRVLIRHLKEAVEVIVSTIDNKIIKVTKENEFVKNVLDSKGNEQFAKLIDILLDELKNEYIPLYFKFIGHQLTDDQKYYLDNDLKIVIKVKSEKTKITNELSEMFEKRIAQIEKTHNDEIKNLNYSIQVLELSNQNTKKELADEEQRSNSLSAELQLANTQERNTEEIFENELRKLKFIISSQNDENNLLKEDISKKCEVIEELERTIRLEYERISAEARKQWEENNGNLLNTQRDLTEKCKALRELEEKHQMNIEFLISENSNLEKNIASQSEIMKSMETKFAQGIFDASMNRVFSENKFNELTTSSDSINRPYVRESKQFGIDLVCENIEDFSGQILTNLESIGVNREVAAEVTDFMIGILSSGITPLICGYKSREIATAVSMAYCGQAPSIITLPVGYANANEILEIFHNSNSDTVLIEDAIGTLNENTLLPLLREKLEAGFQEKLLFLTTENTDSIRYLPNNFLNYFAILRVERFRPVKEIKYHSSDAKNVFQEFTAECNSSQEMKLVKNLTSNLGFGQPYTLSRANIISYTHRVSGDIGFTLESYMRAELAFLAMLQNKQIELEKNIQENNFSDSLKEIARGILNG